MAKEKITGEEPKPSDEFTNLKGEHDLVDIDGDAADDLLPQEDLEDGSSDEEIQFVKEESVEAEAEAEVDVDEEEYEEEDESHVIAQQNADALYQRDVEIIKQRAATLQAQETFVSGQKANAAQLIDAAKAALKNAKEDGDTDAEIEASENLANARHILNMAEQAERELNSSKQQIKAQAQNLLQAKNGGAYTVPRRNVEQSGSKLFPAWRAQNKWFDSTKNRAQRIALVGIDAALSAEGNLDKNTPEYFAELGKRFNTLYPGLYRDVNGNPVATGQKSRRSGPTVPSGAMTAGRTNPNKIRLNETDRTAMEQFGFDPDKAEHRRRWLAEKRAQAARKAQMGV